MKTMQWVLFETTGPRPRRISSNVCSFATRADLEHVLGAEARHPKQESYHYEGRPPHYTPRTNYWGYPSGRSFSITTAGELVSAECPVCRLWHDHGPSPAAIRYTGLCCEVEPK